MNKQHMIALVTGANKGIGLETATQLAGLGHKVYLGARDIEKGNAAKSKINNSENIEVIELDVSKEDSIQKAFEKIKLENGRLDILVNNAAINYDTWQDALSADLNNVRETLETNLFGAWKMIQTFLPLMQQNNYGRIVNVSSGSGAITNMTVGTPGYSISKASLNILTINFAHIASNYDILINSVCPGWVKTDMGGAGANRSVSEGAETIIWAALLQKGAASGKFFRDKKEIPF
ncbi:SDR family oxidoreductase [Flammeovirga sp. SubArs3]|uniref:SDR family oxidoreductase n=1 Tax=Flammeovirga sp. SubArs3 TaxID=2995316 RepID=UPI00248AC4E8|nr:SDR family oxidoreductase [Flammeovirga sp. SubArs3]